MQMLRVLVVRGRLEHESSWHKAVLATPSQPDAKIEYAERTLLWILRCGSETVGEQAQCGCAPAGAPRWRITDTPAVKALSELYAAIQTSLPRLQIVRRTQAGEKQRGENSINFVRTIHRSNYVSTKNCMHPVGLRSFQSLSCSA